MKNKFLNSLSGVFLIGSLFAFLAGIWWFLRGYLAPSACLDFGGAFDYSNWTCKSYDLEFEYAPAMIYFTSHFWALVLSFAIFLWCFRLRHWLMLYKKNRQAEAPRRIWRDERFEFDRIEFLVRRQDLRTCDRECNPGRCDLARGCVAGCIGGLAGGLISPWAAGITGYLERGIFGRILHKIVWIRPMRSLWLR